MSKKYNENKDWLGLLVVLGLSFLWASLSGLIWFVSFGALVERFGVGNDDDMWRIILYAIVIFLFVFLIVFNKEKDDWIDEKE